MTATIHPLPVISPDPAPDFTAAARILASLNFTAGDILWIFADTLEIADPLAAARAKLDLAADRGAEAILKAARR
jgi:hypothetical protein